MKKQSILKSIGEVKLSYITKQDPETCPKITSPAVAVEIVRSLYSKHDIQRVELFMVIYLNRANRVIGWAKTSLGGISGTVVDARIVFQGAILKNASAMIVSHNHPSGQLIPSDADKRVTKKLVEGGKFLEIQVLDHIIITKNGHYSFADQGEI
jgi:DNA repair protein RadC